MSDTLVRILPALILTKLDTGVAAMVTKSHTVYKTYDVPAIVLSTHIHKMYGLI